MSYFKAKMHHGAPPQTPLGELTELTALPQLKTPSPLEGREGKTRDRGKGTLRGGGREWEGREGGVGVMDFGEVVKSHPHGHF